MRWIILGCSLLVLKSISSAMPPDSLKKLDPEQFMQMVKRYHPIARQAYIEVEKSKAEVIAAKGGFDPVLQTYLGEKTFDGVNYYKQISPEISMPTRLGVEFLAGAENLSGERLDPNQTAGQTNYLGLKIPLARDLITDKRRTVLRQAKLYRTLTYSSQLAILNQLLYQSMETYLEWMKDYQTLSLALGNLELANQRLDWVKKMHAYGERSAMDTVEAYTLVQTLHVYALQNQLQFQNSGYELSVFLWKDNGEPLTLTPDVIPDTTWFEQPLFEQFPTRPSLWMDSALAFHPELEVYRSKINMLKTERFLKQQNLLPKADFTYLQLGKGYNLTRTPQAPPLYENNYRYGLKFELPLRLSRERGELKLAGLKVDETLLQRDLKSHQICMKILSNCNQMDNLRLQINAQESNLFHFNALLRAEESLFRNGESSMFLVNSRQLKVYENREKGIALRVKYLKTLYGLQYASGVLR